MDRRTAKAPPQSGAIATNVWTQPFWDAAAQKLLVLPRCGGCGRYRMPPTPFCPHCHSQAIDWVQHDGAGVLYSYTIVDRAIMAGMENALPYVPAIVEFPDADGVRLITNMVGCEIGQLRIGQPVQLVWIEAAEGCVLPAFSIIEDF